MIKPNSHMMIGRPSKRLHRLTLGFLAGVNLFCLAASVLAQAPNDLFASAQVLEGSSGTVSGSNIGCGKEAGEPNHVSSGGRSVWYRWTAPASATVTLDTVGSTFDTMLAAYTGSSVSSLTQVASNDDINYSGGVLQSRISFNALAGTVYSIAVDGYGGASGSITLTWNQAGVTPPPSGPANDHFANATVLDGSSGQVSSSNVNATKEAGEPNHVSSGGRSVWFRWTAPASGTVTIDTVGSNFDTMLAAYTGSSVSSLTRMASNDDINYSGGILQSRVSFNASAGTIYSIAVDGYGGASGSITLNWNQAAAAPPHNHLANARVISGTSGLDAASTVGATKEAGEPNHAGNAGGASVWYQWTPATSGNVTISTEGSGFNTLLAVYTGNSYGDLALRYSNDDIGPGNTRSAVTFEAVIDVTYLIAVDGFNGASGSVVLQWDLTGIGPAHDHFTAAALLEGSAGSSYAATAWATKETGEPNHAGNAGGASVWYRWTAPSGNPVAINTMGSTFDTLLAVYTGGSLSALTLIAENDNDGASPQSRVAFTPVSGTTYRIAVDGHDGAVGNLALNWSQSGTGPANDHLASALAISGLEDQTTASTINATKEAGEPNHAGQTGGASIWFTWTAPASEVMFFETLGSNFDTVLAVYTGSSLSSLTAVGSNNDLSADYLQSRVRFNAVAGTTYRLAVDGVNGASGSVRLKWNSGTFLPDLIVWGNSARPVVSNETFSATHCAVDEGLVTEGTHRLLRFSTETRNQGTADLVLGAPAGNPLFEYALCHGHYHLYGFMSYRLLDGNGQALRSGFKTGFCLLDSTRWDPNASSSSKYDCSNQGIQKGWGDVYMSRLDGQWVVIDGVPDGLYYLEMTVNPYGVIQELDYSNNTVVIPVVIGVPPNDHFANAEVLEANFTTLSSANVNASAESGEPSHANVTARRSVWFQWRPAGNQSVRLDTVGSAFDTILAVYTGTSVSQLTQVASNDDISYPGTLQSRVSFTAIAGVDYMIAVDGYNGASGSIQLNRSTGGAGPQSLAARIPDLGEILPIDEIPITDVVRLPKGELKLGARGRPNRVLWIEVSSDLIHWEPVTTTLADPTGRALFIDKSNFEIHQVPPPGHDPNHDHGNGNGNGLSQRQPHGHEDDYYPPLFFRVVAPDKGR